MPTWVDAVNFVGDTALAVTREVGNTVGDAILETVGVNTKALHESVKDRPEPRQERQTVQNIEIIIQCPLELDECIKCCECGREDLEDIEDFEKD